MPVNFTFLNGSILVEPTKKEYREIVKEFIELHREEYKSFLEQSKGVGS